MIPHLELGPSLEFHACVRTPVCSHFHPMRSSDTGLVCVGWADGELESCFRELYEVRESVFDMVEEVARGELAKEAALAKARQRGTDMVEMWESREAQVMRRSDTYPTFD